jgi:hypothetical protein
VDENSYTTFYHGIDRGPCRLPYLLRGWFMSKLLDRLVYLSFHLTSGEHGMDGIEGRSLIILL